ncbi:MAG: hypothetical protein RR623_08545 [Bacilli bacterium]
MNEGNFEDASMVYQQLFEQNDMKNSYYLSRLGQCLKRLCREGEFLAYCETLENKQILKEKYVKSMLCWCHYNVNIKNQKNLSNNELEKMANSAKFIIENSEQSECGNHNTPYVSTVFRVLKEIKEKVGQNYSKKNNDQILKWLSYLDVDKLSEVSERFEDSEGIEREHASQKEKFYMYKLKALEKNGDYENCSKTCDEAFNKIKKLHYRNEVWFKNRKLYSECKLGNIECLKEYEKFAIKSNEWFIYHKLGLIFWSIGKIDEAIFYCSKAVSTSSKYEAMVNVLQDLGELWNKKDEECSKIFFQACAYFRSRRHWIIPQELDYYIDAYDIDVNEKPNTKMIVRISKEYIESKYKVFEGKIIKINIEKKFGFIESIDFPENIYFNFRNKKNRKTNFFVGDTVYFSINEILDGRKEALEVEKRG